MIIATSACSGGEEVVKVGTMGTYFPFTYTDEEGNLTGYDVEVMRLLDKKMKDVKIEFVTGTMEELFAALDSGSIDMIANQIAKSPEREEKYIFSEDGYIYAQTKLVVSAYDETTEVLADMAGKTVAGVRADYFTDIIDAYNAENGNIYKVKYYDAEYVDIFIDIATERVAGTINDTTAVNGYVKNLGLSIKTTGDVIESSYSYICIRGDAVGADLKSKLDAALSEAHKDGSLSNVSIEWFGEDFTTE
jgi:L-cystine transport system substrate-binding protein